MFGCCSRAVIFASCKNSFCRRWVAPVPVPPEPLADLLPVFLFLGLSTFTATARFSAVCFAPKTSPYPPSPSFSTISYSSLSKSPGLALLISFSDVESEGNLISRIGGRNSSRTIPGRTPEMLSDCVRLGKSCSFCSCADSSLRFSSSEGKISRMC